MLFLKLILFFVATSHQRRLQLKNIDNGDECEFQFNENCENNRCWGTVMRFCDGVYSDKAISHGSFWNRCTQSKLRYGFVKSHIKFFPKSGINLMIIIFSEIKALLDDPENDIEFKSPSCVPELKSTRSVQNSGE